MFGKDKNKNGGANVIQLDPKANEEKKNEQDQEHEQDQENKAAEKKIKFNVELQILRLGRNESLQMHSVEAVDLEEANKIAVEERSKKLKEGYSCIPTGRHSKEEL